MRGPGAMARITAAFLWIVGGAGCSRQDVLARMAAPPTLADAGLGRCEIVASPLRPFIVEWSGADRGALELRLRRGVAAVRYDGCEMTILPDCRIPGEYAYSGFTRKRDALTIRSVDELYARLPIGAPRLESRLARSRELHIDMTLVGMFEADQDAYSRAELEGRCAGATHVISGAQVGAFSFRAGVRADASGLVAAAATDELLAADGTPAACEAASSADPAAPEGCRALLRLEFSPLLPGVRPIAAPPVTAFNARYAVYDASDRPPRRVNHSDVVGANDRYVVDHRRRARGQVAAGGVLLGIGLAGVPMMVVGQRNGQRLEQQLGSFAAGSPEIEGLRDRRDAASGLKVAGAVVGLLGVTAGALLVAAGVQNFRRARELGQLARLRVAPVVGRTYAGLNLGWRF